LLLYTDLEKFLFNASEGTQRVSTEYLGSGKYRKFYRDLSNIFVTSKRWDNLGGLPAVVLGTWFNGSPWITIHGPRETAYLFHRVRESTMANQLFKVKVQTPSDPPLVTSGMRVTHVPIRSQTADEFPLAENYCKWKLSNSHYSRIDPMAAKEKVPYDSTAVAYIVQAPNEKSYLIVEAPSCGHVESISKSLPPSHPKLSGLDTVFHFTPAKVMKSKAYLDWMESLPSTVTHIGINENSRGYQSDSITSFYNALSIICPKLFQKLPPGLRRDDVDPEVNSDPKVLDRFGKNNRYIQADLNHQVTVLEDFDHAYEEDTNPVYNNYVDWSNRYEERVEELHQELRERRFSQTPIFQLDYPKITFLGTVSGMPMTLRNNSSVLVESSPGSYMLFDCGEGTLQQLNRKFGYEKTLEILKNLKAIYISHLHADHQMGFIGIVQQREAAFQSDGEVESVPPLYVLSPPPHADFLMMYHAKYESILQNLVQVSNNELFALLNVNGETQQKVNDGLLAKLKSHCGIESVMTCRAFHCKHAFSVAVKFAGTGFKMVYSGDTRPTSELVQLSQVGGKSDLVIHEATIEHGMVNRAMHARHSTVKEAIQQTGEMGAKFTILTHFHPEYNKIPPFYDVPRDRESDVGFAFDLMTVSPATLHLMPQISEILPVVENRTWRKLLDDRSFRYNRDQEFKESVERTNDFALTVNNKDERLTDGENVFDKDGNKVKGRSVNSTGVPYFRKAGSQFGSLIDDEI